MFHQIKGQYFVYIVSTFLLNAYLQGKSRVVLSNYTDLFPNTLYREYMKSPPFPPLSHAPEIHVICQFNYVQE